MIAVFVHLAKKNKLPYPKFKENNRIFGKFLLVRVVMILKIKIR
jgi:hypothetical protein